MHKFAVKPEIYYAEAAIECLARPDVGRVLIVIDPVMREQGFGTRVEAACSGKNGVEFRYYTDIRPDPPVELVAGGVAAALDFRPDMIVAVGGGSTIDEAKAIVMIYARLEAARGSGRGKPLFAAVPTTSGTGSEVTNVSVITVDGRKAVLADDSFLPDIAVIDVEFTKTLPLHILADTAIDALTHAFEAYISKNGRDCTDAFAEKAVKLIFRYLAEIFTKGDSVEARGRLHNASCIAGMAFTNASLGINHSMAHALGALFHIPHGRANAVFLTKTLAFNSQKPYVVEKLTGLCREMGIVPMDAKDCLPSLIGAIECLLRTCNMPVHVRDLDIGLDVYIENIFPLTDQALADRCTATNPVTPDANDMIRLFMQAYE